MTVERKPRYSNLRFHVAYDDGEGFMTATVFNISETGVFLETTMPLSPGKSVQLTPLLSESAGLFELDGEVVRTEESEGDGLGRPNGMAVRFVGLSDELSAQLRALLAEADSEEVGAPAT